MKDCIQLLDTKNGRLRMVHQNLCTPWLSGILHDGLMYGDKGGLGSAFTPDARKIGCI